MFPYEVLGAGNRGALSIVLRMYEKDFDYICRGSIIGYKVAIHLPGDLPSILSSNHFIHIPTNQETLITFQPEVMRTSSSLQGYSPNERGKCIVVLSKKPDGCLCTSFCPVEYTIGIRRTC